MDPANRGLCQRHRAQIQNRFLKETNNAEGTDGVFSSATPTAAHSWATITLIPAHAAKHGAPPERRRSAGDWSGCENNQVAAFRETLGDIDPERFIS